MSDSIAQSVARLTAVQGLASLNPKLGHITFMEIDHDIISTVILPLPAVVGYWQNERLHKY